MSRNACFILLSLLLGNSVFFAQNENRSGTGIIRGRVTNAENLALANARIYLMKESIPRGYRPNETRTTLSDSMGKYEFTNVAEGNYWIAAQPADAVDSKGNVVLFYFPDKSSMKDSYIFRVGPDAVLTAMDVHCVPGVPERIGFEAKGVALETVSRKPVTNMRMVYGQINNSFVRQDVQTDEKGLFAISRLSPGKYWAAISHEYSENLYCYPIYFEIIDSDLSNLQIQVSEGSALRGMVVLSDRIPGAFFSDHVVVFNPKGISEVNEHPTNYRIESSMEKISPISVDGSFVLKGLPPLFGQLAIRRRAGLPLENKYVVSIERNKTNLSKALRIEGNDITNVLIHVSTGTGSIRGKIKAINSIVELKRIGILISLQNETVSPFTLRMELDANGEFAAKDLVPGEYRVMSTIASPEGLIRRAGDIQVVKLGEGETREVEMPVGN